jgi:hypothetical protein
MQFEGKTQKQIGEEVSTLLRTLTGQRIALTHPVFASLMALVFRHPWADEKIGHGVEAFHVTPNYMNNAGMALFIERIDGSTTDISWRKCIAKRGMTPKQELLAAMRNAIYPQIRAYRRNRVGVTHCEMCGAFCALASHVDHVVTFKSLAEEFLSQRQDVPTDFDSDKQTCLRTFKPTDATFADAWKAFHAERATLRITCPACNLGRNTKGQQ